MRILAKRKYCFEFDGQSFKVPGLLVIHDAPDWVVNSTMFKLGLSDGTIQLLDQKPEQKAAEKKLEDGQVDLHVKYGQDPKSLNVDELKAYAISSGVDPKDIEMHAKKDPIIAIIESAKNPPAPPLDENPEDKTGDKVEGNEDNGGDGSNPPDNPDLST